MHQQEHYSCIWIYTKFSKFHCFTALTVRCVTCTASLQVIPSDFPPLFHMPKLLVPAMPLVSLPGVPGAAWGPFPSHQHAALRTPPLLNVGVLANPPKSFLQSKSARELQCHIHLDINEHVNLFKKIGQLILSKLLTFSMDNFSAHCFF